MVELLWKLKIRGICLDQFNLDLLLLSISLRLCQHTFRQIQTGHGDPVPGKGDGMPAGATADIQHPGTWCQSQFIDDKFNLEFGVFGKNIIEVIRRMTIKKTLPVTFSHIPVSDNLKYKQFRLAKFSKICKRIYCPRNAIL